MKRKQSIIKRVFALALTASIFLGMDGLTYAAAATGAVSGDEDITVSEDVLSEFPENTKNSDTVSDEASVEGTEFPAPADSTESTVPAESTNSTEVTEPSDTIDSTEGMEPSDIVDSTENVSPSVTPAPVESTEDSDIPGSTELPKPSLPGMTDDTEATGEEPAELPAESNPTAPVEVVPPAAPSAVVMTQVTAKSYDTISLQWNALSDVSGYIIERKSSKETNFTQLAVVSSAKKTSYTDKSGIVTGLTYTYRIRGFVSYLDSESKEAQVNGALSNSMSVKVTYTKVPASFKAASANFQQVKLTWKKAAGASGYEIYRSTKATGGFKKIATVSSTKTSYTDKKLTTGTTYYYRIRAYRKNSGITTKAPLSAVKNARPVPQKTTVTASYKNYSTATIKWKKVSGASGYVIYRSTSKNGKYTNIATIKKTGTTSYTDKNLTTGKTYYYKIRAYKNINGKKIYGGYSNIDSVKITLKAPVISSITVKDYRTVTIKWKKVSGANGYILYRSTSQNGTYKKIATVKGSTTLSYQNSGLTTGKKYYYKIKAYRTVNKKNVTSSYSDAKVKSTTLKKVTGITVTPLHANKLKLTWSKVTGATSYNIYRSTSKNGTYKLIKKQCKNPTYTNSGLTNGTQYYYKITANRGSYESALSSYVSGKAASLELSQTSVVVQKRFSVTVTATASPKATVKWSTSNSSIATVSSTGVIRGVGVGSATIYAKANGITRSITVKVRQTLDGIDVSKWQGTVDFKAVKNAGYHFVMIRIYNGYSIDPNFETYYKDAVAAGLGVGVYYYSYATSVEAAQADAKTVLGILNGRPLNYPVVIDMEDNTQLAGLTNQNRTDIAWAFCNTITANGYQAGLYANTYWLEHYFENSQLANMNLWIARWTQSTSIWHGYTGKGNIFMWQYTSDGSVPGISGRVDLNVGFSD